MIQARAQAAIDDYHELLRGEPDATSPAQLMRAIEEGGMIFLGRPICEVLRPLFIESGTYAEVQRAAQLVARAITELSRRLAVDARLRAELGLTPEEEALIQMDPAEPTELVGRFDGFLGADGEIRFVEYNPMPAGIVSGDELRAVYARLPVMEAFERSYATRGASTSHLVSEALLRTHQRKGHTGRPALAVLSQAPAAGDAEPDGASLLLLDEITKLVGMLMAGGFEVRVVDPQELRLENGALLAGDFQIDVAMVANWARMGSALEPGSPFYRAVQSQAIWVLNSASTAILRGSKSVFAMLSDPTYWPLFEVEVAAALGRHVPWTRRVRHGLTSYREPATTSDRQSDRQSDRPSDREIDLLPFLAAHRERFVLKPADEYGASGVVLGWQCDEAAWAAAMERALSTPYVVQERVPIDSQLFPTMAGGELQLERRHFTLDPFVWNDTEVHGAYVRLSRSAIMNLSAGGGSTTPMLILEEQARP